MAPVVTLVIDTVGWRMAMFIFGSVTWIIVLPLSQIVRHRPETYGYARDGDVSSAVANRKEASKDSVGSEKELEKDFKICEVIRTRIFWHFQIGFIFMYSPYMLFLPMLCPISVVSIFPDRRQG